MGFRGEESGVMGGSRTDIDDGQFLEAGAKVSQKLKAGIKGGRGQLVAKDELVNGRGVEGMQGEMQGKAMVAKNNRGGRRRS